jgi:hypothetical protein
MEKTLREIRGFVQECDSCRRQADGVAIPDEQAKPDSILEVVDVVRERRL